MPSGLIQSATNLAASPATFTNTSGDPVTCYLAGGATITSITIDGMNIGITGAQVATAISSFRLPAGKAAVVTYSAGTPTLAVYAD